MGTALNNLFGKGKSSLTGDVEFWHGAERTGWLMKQGEYIKTWRRRWFVLKQGKIFWFKSDIVTPDSTPRGVIEVNRCLSIKGAEDILNKPHAFEVSTTDDSMFFIADTDKEKEDWINAVGRAIVRHSKSMLEHDHGDYTSG
ncbi:Fatty acid synthase subunit beta [Coccomyxa viridis]|uniref:Fatty acid synthase subunit beta n=1 Tax=Coccomyxa viridis TaxID=1274662 RepID=A0AAV1IAW9_9CHLO|nr:Fatty acid synthase subunit beta [Coccomyxa viridis]